MRNIVTAKPTRSRILQTAESLFARHGYGATTLDHIASAVEIKRPSLIYHFSDKASLYQSVLEQLFARQRNFFNVSSKTDLLPLNRLKGLMDSWLDYALQEPNYLRIFLHHLAAGYNPKKSFWIRARPIVRLWESTLSEGQRQGVFREVDLIHFLSMVGGMTAYFILMHSEDEKNIAHNRQYKRFRTHLFDNIKSLVLMPDQ
jgi:TetR/AcrR family transcriptional regulator